MVKRKRDFPTIEEILARPWCYYCERDFDDHKILVGHQKARHFKCPQPGCTRRLNTAGGLGVHMMQVHKVQLQTIENALPGRGDINIEIFAMEGIPPDALQAYRDKVTFEYFRKVAEHRAQTGNLPPGLTAEEAKTKKPKIETAEELKQRLAEHKAKKEAERRAAQLGGEERASVTPSTSVDPFTAPGSGIATGVQGSPMDVDYFAATAPHTQDQFAVQSPGLAAFPPPFPAPFMPPGAPGPFMPAGSPAGLPMPFGLPPGMPPVLPAGIPPVLPTGMPPTMPPGLPPGPPLGMPPSPFMPHPPGMPVGATNFPPPLPFALPQGTQAVSAHEHSFAPPTPKSAQPRPSPVQDLSKQTAPLNTDVPGLPARPSAAMPHYSREEMARLHSGATPVRSPTSLQNGDTSARHLSKGREFSESIDDLISSVRESTQNADTTNTTTAEEEEVTSATTAAAAQASAPVTESDQTQQAAKAETSSKRSKKSKAADNKAKMVYSDNNISPEEKRARSSRYVFK